MYKSPWRVYKSLKLKSKCGATGSVCWLLGDNPLFFRDPICCCHVSLHVKLRNPFHLSHFGISCFGFIACFGNQSQLRMALLHRTPLQTPFPPRISIFRNHPLPQSNLSGASDPRSPSDSVRSTAPHTHSTSIIPEYPCSEVGPTQQPMIGSPSFLRCLVHANFFLFPFQTIFQT